MCCLPRRAWKKYTRAWYILELCFSELERNLKLLEDDHRVTETQLKKDLRGLEKRQKEMEITNSQFTKQLKSLHDHNIAMLRHEFERRAREFQLKYEKNKKEIRQVFFVLISVLYRFVFLPLPNRYSYILPPVCHNIFHWLSCIHVDFSVIPHPRRRNLRQKNPARSNA